MNTRLPSIIAIGIIVFLGLAFSLFFLVGKNEVAYDNPTDIRNDLVGCPEDAKICPDGSSVARIPPSCEFSKCPQSSDKDLLKTHSTDEFSVSYPSGYTAIEDENGVVTISNEKGSIKIGDYMPIGSAGPHGSMVSEEEEEKFAKSKIYLGYEGKIVSSIFYETGDKETQKELEEIQKTIKLK